MAFAAACLLVGLGTSGRLSLHARAAVGPNDAARNAILWRDPGNVGDRDLFHGPTGEARAPRPPFRFHKEDDSGTRPKIQVVDGNGMKWSVKFDGGSGRGREVPAEIAASRIAWALGYLVEESYLVRGGVVEGAPTLERGGRVLDAQGRFDAARFEPRPEAVDRLDIRWTIADNPFAGSRELSGLVILAALVNDWDFRAGNTTVLRVPGDAGPEDRYIVSDWGTAFGGMSPGRSRWDLEDYRKPVPFFTIVGDAVELNLYVDDAKERARVPLAHARWFADLASGLSETQLRKAFEAAGATDAEVRGFAAAFARRVRALREAVGGAAFLDGDMARRVTEPN